MLRVQGAEAEAARGTAPHAARVGDARSQPACRLIAIEGPNAYVAGLPFGARTMSACRGGSDTAWKDVRSLLGRCENRSAGRQVQTSEHRLIKDVSDRNESSQRHAFSS